MKNNWLDVQHRGFVSYLKETEKSDACKKINRMIIGTGKSEESIESVYRDCVVKTDWVEHIENAIPFIENAVRESRQFIIRQGQTVPIEKVKRVSRTSVEHLSRHSELITSEPESDGAILPDKLLMTENVGTYTVYENRFLYMLLCYIRDFAGIRYQKITELAASFSTDITLNKQVYDGTRNISFSLQFSESAQMPEISAADGEICRIRSILQAVELLLRTDLMQEVREAPLLKPPITRTNVMLHDPNFKAAFELYTFLAAYDEAGFEQIERYRSDGALSDAARGDLAELVAITSYLSYRCGGMRDALQERYLAEEERRKKEEDRAKQERIAALKARIGPLDGKTSEYIIALEQRIAELDGREDRLLALKASQEQLQIQLQTAAQHEKLLQSSKLELERAISEKDRQIGGLIKENEQHQARYEKAQSYFEAEYQRQKQEFLDEYEVLKEKYHLACAVSRSFSDSEDCSSREAFEQLDAQYRAFRRFYNKQWKLARKQIRKEMLWKK